MRRHRTTPLNRRTEKALIALQAAMNADAAIKATFRLLKNAVRCDFVNVCLRNVREDERHTAYRLIDSRGREFEPALLDTFFPRTSRDAGADGQSRHSLHQHPGNSAARSRAAEVGIIYREMMQVMGFRHAVAMFFWNDPPVEPEAIFSILRGENHPDFDDTEVAIFDRLYPHIDAMLQRVRTMKHRNAPCTAKCARWRARATVPPAFSIGT